MGRANEAAHGLAEIGQTIESHSSAFTIMGELLWRTVMSACYVAKDCRQAEKRDLSAFVELIKALIKVAIGDCLVSYSGYRSCYISLSRQEYFHLSLSPSTWSLPLQRLDGVEVEPLSELGEAIPGRNLFLSVLVTEKRGLLFGRRSYRMMPFPVTSRISLLPALFLLSELSPFPGRATFKLP